MPLDADLPGVDRLVGLEIIQGAACTPGPGTQRSPVIDLAWLPLVAQPDDPFRKPRTVVGLDAGRSEEGVSPSLGKNLLLPRRAAAAKPAATRTGRRLGGRGRFARSSRRLRRTRFRRRRGPTWPATKAAEAELLMTGTGPVALAGVVNVS